MKKRNITHLLFPVELNMFLVMPSRCKTIECKRKKWQLPKMEIAIEKNYFPVQWDQIFKWIP